MHNSSVKWGHLENLDPNSTNTQFSLLILWGHVSHFEPNSTNTIFSTNPMGSSIPLWAGLSNNNYENQNKN